MTSWRTLICCFVITGAAAGSLGAQAFTEPKWPQPFSLERGDHAAYGIAVGAPGAIVASATANGAIIVSIVRPNGTVAKEMQGAGTVRVDYPATAQDVAAGVAWRIGVRSAAAAAVRGGRLETAAAGSGVSGTIAVEHPAGDPGKVAIAKRQTTSGAVAPVRLEAMLAEVRSARAKTVADSKAKRLGEVQAKLLPAATQAIGQRSAGRVSGAGGGVSTTQSASTGATPVGGGGSQVQSVAAAPAIASLDVASGSPGQQILVTGSGFGPAPAGEVHFLLAPGKDLPGSVTYWSDTQIAVQVPDISGVPAFAGQVYVRRGTTNSRLLPFGFVPELAVEVLPITADRQVSGLVVDQYSEVWHNGWPGIKGDDEWFLHTTLKNGWVIDDAFVINPKNPASHAPDIWDGKGDAYVSEFTRGSNAPRIKVHWWGEVDSFTMVTVRYWPVVVITGPKGLPWQ